MTASSGTGCPASRTVAGESQRARAADVRGGRPVILRAEETRRGATLHSGKDRRCGSDPCEADQREGIHAMRYLTIPRSPLRFADHQLTDFVL